VWEKGKATKENKEMRTKSRRKGDDSLPLVLLFAMRKTP